MKFGSFLSRTKTDAAQKTPNIDADVAQLEIAVQALPLSSALSIRSAATNASNSATEGVDHAEVLARHIYKVGLRNRWFPRPTKNQLSLASSETASPPGNVVRRGSEDVAMTPLTGASPVMCRTPGSPQDYFRYQRRASSYRLSPGTPLGNVTPAQLDAALQRRQQNSSSSSSSQSPRGPLSPRSPTWPLTPATPGPFGGDQLSGELQATDAAVALRLPGSSVLKLYPPVQGALADAARAINVGVILKIESRIVKSIIASILQHNENISDVPIDAMLRIQVITDIADLPRARLAQHAAFVLQGQYLLVWSNHPESIVQQTVELERRLLNVCLEKIKSSSKIQLEITEIEIDLEEQRDEVRQTVFLTPLLVGLSSAVLLVFAGLSIRSLVVQILADGNMTRLVYLIFVPLFAILAAFFANVLAVSFLQIFGPVKQLTTNSKYYSATAPARDNIPALPHITIQCPVYKESFTAVIQPTMDSIQRAISTYELQGGTASIFVNDDGMQLLTEEQARIREKYYDSCGIGWCARPPHGQDGFVRAGKFKKASNMNYALRLSCQIEKRLTDHQRAISWTAEDEGMLYNNTLAAVLRANPGAKAAGNIRVGDLILLIDSDTRVPEDCLLDAALEFHRSPELSILQHQTGVMIVIGNYWEHCIAHFTRMVYHAIRYACASGDVAPFVGHNAFLRWSAMQEVCNTETDSEEETRWWSESHVSEDFEMALKLQMLGYIIRYASYSDCQFLEGVSLTVYDELARWQKYAYGCSELVFNPLRSWFTQGPITKIFRTFLKTSAIPGFYKFNACAYIFSYYAIASAIILCPIGYFLTGWFGPSLDHFYVPAWEVFLACIFLFGILSPLLQVMTLYRSKNLQTSFSHAIMVNYGWTLLLLAFFSGLSLHVATPLVAHLLGIDMVWGITAKELDKSNFWIELPKIAKLFRASYIFFTLLIAGMIYLACPLAPSGWRIDSAYSTLPLAWMIAGHCSLPIIHNPQLMTFSF